MHKSFISGDLSVAVPTSFSGRIFPGPTDVFKKIKSY